MTFADPEWTNKTNNIIDLKGIFAENYLSVLFLKLSVLCSMLSSRMWNTSLVNLPLSSPTDI